MENTENLEIILKEYSEKYKNYENIEDDVLKNKYKLLNSIYNEKPKSIFDHIDKDFFVKYNNDKYLFSNNYYEWYWALGKAINPINFLEIGVRYGFSFLPIIQNSSNLKSALGWDLETYGNNSIANSNIKKYYTGNAAWDILHVDSQKQTELPMFYDLVSIDGCHDYDCKVHDLKLCIGKCRYVILDDYDYHQQVKDSVDFFINEYSDYIEWNEYIPTFRGSQLIKFKDETIIRDEFDIITNFNDIFDKNDNIEYINKVNNVVEINDNIIKTNENVIKEETTVKKLPIEYVEHKINNKKYILFKNDVGVSDSTRNSRFYEQYIFDYIKNNNINVENKNIIDIGANFGYHTLEFADMVKNGKVYSFEPQELVYYQLCGNVILNGFSNVKCYNLGLSDENGTSKVQDIDYFSDGKINIGDCHLNYSTNHNSKIVDIKTLDDFNFDNVSIIKIDVQGFEPKVLDGAIKTINNNKPIIFIEVEAAQLNAYKYTNKDVFDRLDKLGYTYKKLIDAEHLVDYVAIHKSMINNESINNTLNKVTNTDEYHISYDTNSFETIDGYHFRKIYLPVPKDNMKYSDIIIKCSSSWSITIMNDNTYMEDNITLNNGEYVSFEINNNKWKVRYIYEKKK